MSFSDVKRAWKRVWHFIWDDDSLASWLLNILLAFILVKFIIYPGLGLILGTTHPVVAVVSGSMEHRGYDFDDWWALNKQLYWNFNISKEDFYNYRFRDGFNKGDLMILVKVNDVKKGDVIVFRGAGGEPIIHRVVVAEYRNGKKYIQTKGDNNSNSRFDEAGIPKENLIGKAKFRVPYLGWFKLGFLKLLGKA